MALTKDQVIAELKTLNAEFDPEASYNDLFATLRLERVEAENANQGGAGAGAGDGAGAVVNTNEPVKKGKGGEATMLTSVKHNSVFYKKGECVTLDEETFELFKSQNFIV